jgi:tetratricopeptide (TPR) repeat protein
LGNFAEAEKLFDEALKHSDNPNLSAKIAQLTEKKLGMLSLTLRLLDVQLHRNPSDLHSRQERIRLLRKTEQYEQALSDAEWLCETLPEDPHLFFTKAEVLLELGRVPQACQAWQVAQDLGYDKPHKNLAFFCEAEE